MNVFVMMPFQDSFRQVYEEVIAPVVRENDMEPVVLEPGVGRAVVPGPIDAQIIDAIKTSYFCIADLTGNNPNVMYEVAYAHALGKKVILITMRVASDLPVDVRHHGAIEYSPDNDYETLRVGLHRSIREFLDAGGEEIQLLRRALTPASIDANATQFVVATNPRSYRAAFGRVGGQGGPPRTFSDYVGIRGLMQSFGSIYGLGKLPELLNPDDFNDRVFDEQQWINLYTIGSPKSNRWTGMLMAEFFANHTPGWEFKPDPESNEIMNPRVIVRQGGESYVIEGVEDVDIRKWDFGLVIRGPHPKDPRCMFLVLAGRSSLGTEAACLAVTVPDCLKILNKKLNGKGIDLNDHLQAFCAIVSVRAENRITDINSFTVHDIFKY